MARQDAMLTEKETEGMEGGMEGMEGMEGVEAVKGMPPHACLLQGDGSGTLRGPLV